jgi:hypothetical protein
VAAVLFRRKTLKAEFIFEEESEFTDFLFPSRMAVSGHRTLYVGFCTASSSQSPTYDIDQ